MSYKTRITPEARAAISSWGLGRENIVKAYNFLLIDLAADPDQHLGERIPPRDLFACYLTLGRPPRRVTLLFAVRRLDKTRELHVVGGDCRDELDLDN